MNSRPELTLTVADHRAAFTEVSFLLDIFAATVSHLMGGATASVGRIAGRHFARKMPVTFVEPAVEPVLDALAQQLQRGTEISYVRVANGADLTITRCAMRSVCRSRGSELGGDVCRLYHLFLDGVVGELTTRPTKSTITEVGDVCRAHMEIRE